MNHILISQGTVLVVFWIGILETGCPQIPIQANRIDTVLHYALSYELDPLLINAKPTSLGPQILIATLGRKNFCEMSDGVRERYQHGLLSQDDEGWKARGFATAVMSPSPWWPDGFIFEALGHNVIREHARVIATSDFYVTKQSISDVKDLFTDIRELSDGERDLRWIDLLIRQIIVREIDLGIPDNTNKHGTDKRFLYESEAVIRLYIMPLNASGVFTIAPVPHEIGIVSPREPETVYSIGCLKFDDPIDERKIFDVRGRNSVFLAKDYPDILHRAGIREHTESFRPHWYGRPCTDTKPDARYRSSLERSAKEWVRDPQGTVFKRLFEPAECPPKCPAECKDTGKAQFGAQS